MIVAGIDIGSTWTKGVLFDVDTENDDVRIVKRSTLPTRIDNLSSSFVKVLREISGEADPFHLMQSGQMKLQYSSSAKGGLAVSAIGLVPEITLSIGKIAAQSAGARLAQVFSYHLTSQDLLTLEESSPDIILFAGGTDGGDSQYVLSNARKIAETSLNCDIIYAGNRSISDDVRDILKHKKLTVVENLLPNFNEPQPEPAQNAIREVFLKTIVKGKGLDEIERMTGGISPLPTPFVVLEFVRAIHKEVQGWEEFLMIDMGGATTDIYSVHKEVPAIGTILRGIYEPIIKRTVEGDLGMRVSAHATARVGASNAAYHRMEIEPEKLINYADSLINKPDFLPADQQSKNMDQMLAGICTGQACARHVGRWATMFTVEGEVKVQTGRDLTKLDKVIGTGGWLSRDSEFQPSSWFSDYTIDTRGQEILMPKHFNYYRDEESIFPLLANLAREYPKAAANAGVKLLVKS